MKPEETGLVSLEDLPQNEVYITLKKDFFNLLNENIRCFGIYNLAKQLKVSRRIIMHWLSDGSLIRLDILSKICKYYKINFKENIEHLRGKKGGKIKNPKLPFDFTSNEGVRVIAGILGDGGIRSKKLTPHYSNSNRHLTNGFINDINYVLGNVEFSYRISIKKNTKVKILEFSSLIYKIFHTIGLKEGKKVETNQGIPHFIFNLEDKKKLAFLTQFIDDEGSISIAGKSISLTAACLNKYGKPNILKDIQNLIASLDILCSIYQDKIYSSSRGENRRIWRLQINGQIQLRKIYENTNIRSIKKKRKLERILKSYKLLIFRKRDIINTYINFMNKIQNSQGYFTSLDLAKGAGRDIGTSRNTILKFQKLKLIKCVKPPTSGDYHEYGRYIVVK